MAEVKFLNIALTPFPMYFTFNSSYFKINIQNKKIMSKPHSKKFALKQMSN